MAPETSLRNEIVTLLRGDNAHMTFADAVAAFPESAMNQRPPNVPYTPWHLLEHLRIAQRDILDYIIADTYTERDWPVDYWPAPDATADRAQWNETVRQFEADLAALIALTEDETLDLNAAVKHATAGQTLARELFTVAAHNSYHIGEFAILRQVMGTWPAGHE